MEFRLLGPVEVLRDGQPVALGGRLQRVLLVHLLLRANRPVPAERLIDEVWGEAPPAASRSSLQAYVSRLRKAFGSERLEGRSGGYLLHVDPSELDVSRFERLTEQARAGARTDPADAAELYREALACWRGPALDDLGDEPSLRAEIARLEELRLAATEGRIDAKLSLGQHEEVVAELESLTASHPLRERLWGQLMVALYRCARQGDALAAFQRARETLAEELGVDPSPELQRLEEQVLRQDPALDAAGVPLRGYRLLERIGEGSFGVVHRAVQPQVGREVAVKVLHPALANDPRFIRRFEAEAQLVARLEHPHLVPLYDYWRDPEGAYLVMRYLRGGNLRDALGGGPLGVDEALRVVDHVGVALALAHRQGIVHRDVKPENVLFDQDGNAYLSDFGIAKDLADVHPVDGGRTPSGFAYYLSPEEARGEPPTARTDIYSLGLVVFEMLAGRHPYADTPPEDLGGMHLREPVPPLHSVGADVPAAVDEVIAQATAKDPRARYPDPLDLASALRGALRPAGHPVTPAAVASRNPYKGLRAFEEADAGDFFGRQHLVERLVERLAEPEAGSRFLAVVGPSGSGKSSLVRAGLVPALRGGAVPGSESWFVVDMVPGADPFAELQAALRRVAARPLPPNLAAQLADDPDALTRAAGWVLPGADHELLLVVDQFEELFTLGEDAQRRAGFLAGLVAAATDPASRMRVVATLRADFYDRPLAHPGLAPLVRARTEVVVPLTPAELERAVTGPAEQVGTTIDPGLAAQLVADVADQPGALPLLQYALTELFDRREDATLTQTSYAEIGGVSGALARRADETFAALTGPAQQAAHQLFLRLVTLGEGTEDTRRRVSRAGLLAVEGQPGQMQAAIEAFGDARLLSFDRDPDTREPTVEVAHEALLREWPRLRAWVDTARDDLRTEQRLAHAAGDWIDAGRDTSFLASGSRLEQFEAWRTSSVLTATPEEREFLAASLAERDHRTAENQARQARERGLERRSMRRLRALVAVFAVAALVAGGLTAVTLRQTDRLAEQVRITTARELATAAIANLDVDPERSILLALEAVDVTRSADGAVLPEAEEALRRAVKASRIVRIVPQGDRGLAVTAAGDRFATTGQDGTATVWDTETGEQVQVLGGHEGPISTVTFSPDGRLVVTTGASDATVRVWEGDEELHVLRGHERFAAHAAFSLDGRWLATSGGDATVRLWDVAGGTEERTLSGHEAETYSPVFSADGRRLASASGDATARIWDPATGETVHVLAGHDWGVEQVAFSPDGTRAATASLDVTARTWDADSGEHLLTLFGHSGEVFAVEFSPDGRRIATGSGDGTARLWDADTGRPLLPLAGHAAGVANVVFTPDGEHLLTAGFDGTTRLWDISVGGARDWLTVPAAADIFTGVAFSPDSRRFAAPSEPTGVTVWDATTGTVVASLEGHETKLADVAFSPDGRRVAASSTLSGTVPVWDVDSGELVLVLPEREDHVRFVAFSPDGSRLLTGGSGTARVWDANSGEEHAALPLDEGAFSGGFAPDGALVAIGDTAGEVTLWDATSFDRAGSLDAHAMPVTDLAFGPEGLLATAGWDGTAKIWDVDAGEELLALAGHEARVNQIAISADGARVATTSDDGTVKLWDAEDGRELLTLYGHDIGVHGVAFSLDGRLLASASPDGTAAVHLLPFDEFLDLARTRVTRSLTDEECRRYLHVEECPQA